MIVALIVGVVVALPLAWYGGTAGAVWGAAIIVVTAGGGIAYLGDVIGYSLGKKRVTLFNLRPRDTAKVIGIAAGAVSALAAAVFLLSIDAAFRRALFKGHELAHNLVEMRHQNTSLEAKIGRSAMALQTAEQGKLRAQSEQVAARADLSKARIALADANGQLDVARITLQHETATLQIAQTNLRSRQADLDTATKAIKIAQAQTLDFEERNRVARRQYDEIKNDIVNVVNPTITVERSSEVIYRNGQEVGRCVVQNGPRTAVIQSLNNFLDTLSGNALAAGADKAGSPRAVKLATIEVKPTLDKSESGADPSSYVGEAESINALADQISSSSYDSVVVIASSVGNSFAKIPVVLQLRPYRNRLAISAGTVLAEVTVRNDGSLDPNDIVGDVQTLLVTKVRPAAMDAGVIPVIESANTQAKLGDLSVGDLLRIAIQAEALKGDATIRAIAAADIWSGDKLKLRFTVTPASALSSGTGAGIH